MDEQTTTLNDLKTAFDHAVEERKIIDAKIAEIKKSIQEFRKKAEDIDKKTDIYVTADGTEKPFPIPDIKNHAKGLLQLVVKYLIPIILIMVFLFVWSARNKKNDTTTTSFERPAAVRTVSYEEANQTYWDWMA